MSKQAEFSKRGSKTGNTRRMRVYSLHEEQVEIIQAALELARHESNTAYDSVALERICMHYLAYGGAGTAKLECRKVGQA